ncbi:MAG: hypothetical protein AAF267_11970, partial [Deinococcota bacterium]
VCVVFSYYISTYDGILSNFLPSYFDYGVTLLNSMLITFPLTALALNCIFLKFKNKLLAIFLVSCFDIFIFYHLISFYFTYWGRWDWVDSLGVFNVPVMCIPFCICRVTFIRVLPLKRSKEFIKLYFISFVVLLVFLIFV